MHCCSYLISPFRHRLQPLDVAFVKAIHSKANTVPVVEKGYTRTLKEQEHLRKGFWMKSRNMTSESITNLMQSLAKMKISKSRLDFSRAASLSLWLDPIS